ncbi:unnamed protein product [Cuscuta europaea]|uniref:Uncharacterized protein n=1 Tax=Cuscuta europaea TaxID=41803 RepID=A0A9P0YTK5_CUSEU|nr:unnamed protein product [Cuscuta europaea]
MIGIIQNRGRGLPITHCSNEPKRVILPIPPPPPPTNSAKTKERKKGSSETPFSHSQIRAKPKEVKVRNLKKKKEGKVGWLRVERVAGVVAGVR